MLRCVLVPDGWIHAISYCVTVFVPVGPPICVCMMPRGGRSRNGGGARGSLEMLERIPEEGTPLRFSFPRWQIHQPASNGHTGGSGGSSSKGQSPEASPKTAQRAAKQLKGSQEADVDAEVRDANSSATSWLSRRLRWPVVPVYSDIGTGGRCYSAAIQHQSDKSRQEGHAQD